MFHDTWYHTSFMGINIILSCISLGGMPPSWHHTPIPSLLYLYSLLLLLFDLPSYSLSNSRGCNDKYLNGGEIVCVSHIFTFDSNFTIIHFWPTSLVPFFLHHWKKRIVDTPQISTSEFQMSSPLWSCLQFWQCSRTGAILRNATALSVFLHTPVALQSENQASQKNAMTMLRTEITEPDSKSRAKHRCFVNSDDEPALRTIKARCPKPPMMW